MADVPATMILRGANSPLPHCGPSPAGFQRITPSYEGRIRPSLIAAYTLSSRY